MGHRERNDPEGLEDGRGEARHSPTISARIKGAAAPGGLVEGRIIRVEGTRAYINLGSASGLKVGDKFNVISLGAALIDPDTGASLGAPEKQTGGGAVVEVQEKFAIIEFTGQAKDKDTVRKQ